MANENDNLEVQGEETEETQTQEQTFDMNALEADTESRLGEVFGDRPTPEPTDEEGVTTPDSEDVDGDGEPTPEDQAGEADTASEELAETPSDTDDSAGQKPLELSPAEIRAAVHVGWDEKVLKELAAANPALAKNACQNALNSTNELSRQFSELGKRVKEAEANVSDTDADRFVQPTTPKKPPTVDLSAIQEQYGDDPIFGVVKGLADQNAALAGQIANIENADMNRVSAKEQQAEDKIDAATAQAIDQFFTGPEVQEYKEYYGDTPSGSKDWEDLTQKQIGRRWAVVETASLILAGAEATGIDMELEEAFQRAHLAEVAPIQATIQRDKLKQKMVKRQKSFTLEPHSDAKVMQTGPMSRTQLESVTSQRLAKTFK